MKTDNLYKELEQSIAGEVFVDLASRRLYATDASIYQEIPRAIVRPKNKNDCTKIVTFAHQHQIPLIPRAAGTSIAGQCVGNGMVVDVSRHMTQILSEVKNNTIRVQPGVILDDLNNFVSKCDLRFAQNISTSNRCMMGGMIGNNACGSHSLLYGTTRDHVLEIEALLSDGTTARFGSLSQDELENKLKQHDLEGDIYRTIHHAISANLENIKKHYPHPHPEIIRRNTGYALDYLANNQPWNKTGKAFNLAPFLCGSEGTLVLLTEATLQLVPIPKHKLLICVHFVDLVKSMRATVAMLPHKPAAIELIDQRILECTQDNLEQRRNRFWIQGKPRAILVIELFDDEPSTLEQRAQLLIQDLQQQGLGYAYPIIRGEQMNKVWALRKAGLGLLMGIRSEKKAVSVIEDTAVAVQDLPAYINRIQQIMEKHQTPLICYGHASVGLLHLRPQLDLREDKKKFLKIADEVADLVAEFKGSLSGEHGDGRVRGPYVKKMLGDAIYQLLVQIKQTFDPKNIFNPNKIITNLPIDQDLRFDRLTPKTTIKSQFNWEKDLGLRAATEKCNGSGTCRKTTGTMCPSYMVTKEEYYSTRGRTNLLRQALNSPNPLQEFASEELKKTLDLCLSCKGCKSECPANVDMARFKAEFLHHYYNKKGIGLKTRLMRHYALMLSLGAKFPRITNRLAKNNWLKKRLRVAKQRQLPIISTQSLKKWWKQHKGAQKSTNGQVILLCDIFTQYHEPQIAQAAIQFLEHNGYTIIPIFLTDSPRLLISQGLLKPAKKALGKILEHCYDLVVNSGMNLIGLEPSELLTLRDEAIDLVEANQREKMRTLSESAKLFEEFILQELSLGKIDLINFPDKEQQLILHIHCHQKSLVGIDSCIQALKQLPGTTVTALQTGCCGMSGAFGYEYYEISMKIGEMQLFPAIRQAPDNAVIVATGTSCRHQIADGVATTALHPAQIFWNSINPR